MNPAPLTPHRLRLLLLGALGASVACGPPKTSTQGPDTGLYPGGDGTDGADGTDGSDGTDGTGGTGDHWETCSADMPDLTREMILEGWVASARLCADPEDLGGTCPAGADFNATAVMYDQFALGEDGIGWDAWVLCGPDTHTPDRCCYEVEVSMWAEGRPFRVEAQPRTASSQDNPRWCTAPEDGSGLAGAPAAVAEAWQRRGLAEHASVSAFARFALHLMHLGAPPELLLETSVALADETRHAQACFGIARAMGHAAGPGALSAAGALGEHLDTRAILTDLLLEGCLGETLAAAEAAEEARLCGDEHLRTVLTGISEDEARHAALSWRAAQWLLAQHPELRGHAARVLATPFPPAADRTPGVSDAVAHRFGVLGATARDRLARQVERTVLQPAAAALLAPQPVCGMSAEPPHRAHA